MAKVIALIGLFFVSVVSQAQTNNSQFTKAQDDGWLVNIEEAYQVSKQTNRPILANFTGSDWCGWCKRLRAEVFSKPEFKKWAKDNVILLELDFPRRKRLPDPQMQQNRGLQQAFRVTGYPTIWVFDLEKPETEQSFQIHALGKTGYVRGGADNFTQQIDKMISRKALSN